MVPAAPSAWCLKPRPPRFDCCASGSGAGAGGEAGEESQIEKEAWEETMKAKMRDTIGGGRVLGLSNTHTHPAAHLHLTLPSSRPMHVLCIGKEQVAAVTEEDRRELKGDTGRHGAAVCRGIPPQAARVWLQRPHALVYPHQQQLLVLHGRGWGLHGQLPSRRHFIRAPH